MTGCHNTGLDGHKTEFLAEAILPFLCRPFFFLSLLNNIEGVEPSKSMLGGTAKSQCYRHEIPTLEGAVVYKFGSQFPSTHTKKKIQKNQCQLYTADI